nr:serine/threonine-protein kinase [Ornithinimicrobium sp. F0845]
MVDPLGEGGGGVVWRAWDRRERQYVAAKVLRQVDAASLLRFIREQAVRIEHPHVLTPGGWAGEDDRVLFTMPIVRGGSVATLIGDFGPLPPRLTAVLLDQALAALEQIHDHGVVHRDVKPGNLLLDATGRDLPHLRLSDFGIAAAVDQPRLTHGPVTLGTEGYLAPECRQPGWDPDPRADLYAVGMSALEMVTGQRPAPGAPLEALAGADVPEPLLQFIRGLGEFDPQRRTATAAAAREELAATGLLDGRDPEQILGDIEVFDHVPELPPGWTTDGPGVAASTTTPPPVRDRRGLGLAVLLLVAGGVALMLAVYLAWG